MTYRGNTPSPSELLLFLLSVHQITVGRSTAENHVDVDLSLEGPAWKISRRQVSINMF